MPTLNYRRNTLTVIRTYFKEGVGSARAEIKHNDPGQYYYIDFYDVGGNKFFREAFPNKALCYVESAAENWTKGIKILNE